MEEDVVQLINKAKMMDLIDEDSTIVAWIKRI
jgi:hypothetical protein